jgi:hypothetical protein
MLNKWQNKNWLNLLHNFFCFKTLCTIHLSL